MTYETLMQAISIISVAMRQVANPIPAAGNSPAYRMLYHASDYLLKQAEFEFRGAE